MELPQSVCPMAPTPKPFLIILLSKRKALICVLPVCLFEMLADAEIGVFSLLQWCFGIRSHVTLVWIDFSLTIPIMGLPHLPAILLSHLPSYIL